MFDGNHRSRRTINLSKSTRRNARSRGGTRGNRAGTRTGVGTGIGVLGTGSMTSDRGSILQQSKEAREKRMLETKRLNAAKCIQKNWRGYHRRKSVVRHFIQLLGLDLGLGQNQDMHGNANVKMEALWNAGGGGLLSDTLVKFVNDAVKRKLLLRIAAATTTTLLPLPLERYVIYERIVYYSFMELQRDSDKSGDGDTSSSYRMLFMSLLSNLLSNQELLQKLITSNIHSFGVRVDGMSRVEVQLISSLATFANRAASKAIISDGNSNVTDDNDQDSSKKISTALMKLSTSIVKLKHEKSAHQSHSESFMACMAAIVLGIDMEVSKSFHWAEACGYGIQKTSANNNHQLQWYSDLFTCLAQFKFMQVKTTNQNTSASDYSFVQQLMKGKEVFCLKNLLELASTSSTSTTHSSSLTAMKFIADLLDESGNNHQSPHLDTLVILSGLVAKGVDIDKLLVSTDSSFSSQVIDLTNDESDDEDDHDDDGDMTMSEPSSNRTTKTAVGAIHSRTPRSCRTFLRKELQTTLKLDQLYKNNLYASQKIASDWLRQYAHAHSSDNIHTSRMICHIAKGLGGGEFLARFIPELLQVGSASVSTSSSAQPSSQSQGHELKQYFFDVLSITLRFCTGVKARDCAMSPLLSKLAFNSIFMERLWAFIKEQLKVLHMSRKKKNLSESERQMIGMKTWSSITCFCDLFAHQLLALDDEEFLSKYTDTNILGKASTNIHATDIISAMNEILHDLYWKNPVIAQDFSFILDADAGSDVWLEEKEDYHRARLLLSGTKLWNSLYERWSRLYRTARFCGEELWWFPYLSSREHDERGAVNPRDAGSGRNPMPMDEGDDSSVDSAMDIEQEGNTSVENENEALASSFRDPKMARILASIPQALPFDRRARLFSSLLAADIAKTQDESEAMHNMMLSMSRGIEGAEYRGSEKVKIRRDELYNDSMDQLSKMGHKLRKRIQVTFVSQHTGEAEAGIDGGGVFREFVDDLLADAFSPESNRSDVGGPLVVESPVQTLAINTKLDLGQHTLRHYQFLGRVLGKAMYESILVEPQFSLPFLNQLLGKHNTLDDLKNVDPEYYKQLRSLRNMSRDEIDALHLTFELTTISEDGKGSRTVELVPRGRDMRVTKENVVRYAHLVAHRRLNIETAAQTNAFLHGFRDLIPASWVKLFSPYELQRVISGDDAIKGFDVKGLKDVMLYSGGYHPSQPIMQWFWEVIGDMNAEQQRKLLKFMTSCSRQPLLGFRALVPLPCVQQIRLRDDEQNKLPTSSTCMNLLKLPNYKSKELLKAKLLYAIEAGAGFELS